MKAKMMILLSILLVFSIALASGVVYGKYVARVNVGSVEISFAPTEKPSQLPDGKTFNRYFNNLLSGLLISTIIFDSYENYPEMRRSSSLLDWDIGVYDDDVAPEDRVKIHYRLGGTAYVLSENTIHAGSSCEEMFKNCTNLRKIEFNNFDTRGVTSMKNMFLNCSSLSTLVMNFDTSSVTDMSGMFYGCRNMLSLDLSSFDTSAVTNMREMFYGCRSLRRVYVSRKWSNQRVTDGKDCFKNCSDLVGGNGTQYNDNNVSAVYARIDVPGARGYFTQLA